MWIDDGTPVSAIVPPLRPALDYWRRARPSRTPVPDRSDVDPPLALPSLLPVMILFEIERPLGVSGTTRDYRYRVLGTELVDRAGVEMTGRRLTEVLGPAVTQKDFEIYRRIEETGLPFYGRRISMISKRRDFEAYHRLLLPLRRGGSRIELIWAILHFDPAPDERRRNRRD